MQLREYLQQMPRGMAGRHAFAAQCGTVYDYIRQIAYGHRQASTDMAKKIEAATGGAVPKASIRPDVWELPPPAAPRRRPAAVLAGSPK